jgi:hypothetical protein
MRSRKIKIAGASILFGLLMIHAVNATVIYSDDFDGDGTSSLIGTTPDTTQSTEVWQGIESGAQWTSDGAITDTADQSRIAYLDFTPESGNVYTLSVDVSHLNKARAFYFGFMSSVPTEGQSFFNGIATPWMRIQGNGETWAMITGTGGSGQTVAVGGYTGQSNFMQVVLDTTEAAWSVDWLLNGTSIQTFTYSSNPDIQFVGMGRLREGTYDVDSFELSVVPEPTSMSLVVFTGGLLFMLRRKVTQ